MKTQHTPGPWFVIPDFAWQGKHPYHDARYVATSDQVEIQDNGEDNDPPKCWHFVERESSIICTMPDSQEQKANARLIAAAPDLLEACKLALPLLHKLFEVSHGIDGIVDSRVNLESDICDVRDAIVKATNES